MRAFRRAPAPAVLLEHAADWTAAWVASTGRFRWPQHQGQPVNRLLEPALLEQTQHHCAYCDHFPLRVDAMPEIDHFRPKGSFRALAFDWANLYGACRLCNGTKLERWDDRLLRPDEEGYEFYRYFEFDVRTGEVLPRPDAPEADRERARVTIEVFGFNTGDRPVTRRRIAQAPEPEAELRAFRFLFD